MESRINLKPCPFCGGRVEIVTGVTGLLKGVTMIHCKQCGSLTSFQKNEAAVKAIEMWNRRV